MCVCVCVGDKQTLAIDLSQLPSSSLIFSSFRNELFLSPFLVCVDDDYHSVRQPNLNLHIHLPHEHINAHVTEEKKKERMSCTNIDKGRRRTPSKQTFYCV